VSTLSVLPAGELSPRQILLGAAHDPDIGEVSAAVILRYIGEDMVASSYSAMDLSTLALLARYLQIEVDARIKAAQ
jgi:hypothetical protein